MSVRRQRLARRKRNAVGPDMRVFNGSNVARQVIPICSRRLGGSLQELNVEYPDNCCSQVHHPMGIWRRRRIECDASDWCGLRLASGIDPVRSRGARRDHYAEIIESVRVEETRISRRKDHIKHPDVIVCEQQMMVGFIFNRHNFLGNNEGRRCHDEGTYGK